jgi:hypothetical protein
MSGITSGEPQPGIRTYNPQVRVGNWNEDVCLEEDLMKDFLERKDNGTLLIQKKAKLRESYLAEVELTESKDGYIHFGDKVMIMNKGKSLPVYNIRFIYTFQAPVPTKSEYWQFLLKIK